MPIFEYICRQCGREFETLVFGSQEVRCEGCGSGDVTKRFSTFGMSGVERPFAGGSSCSKSSCSKSSCSSCK